MPANGAATASSRSLPTSSGMGRVRLAWAISSPRASISEGRLDRNDSGTVAVSTCPRSRMAISTPRFFFQTSARRLPLSAATYTAPTMRSRVLDSTGTAATRRSLPWKPQTSSDMYPRRASEMTSRPPMPSPLSPSRSPMRPIIPAADVHRADGLQAHAGQVGRQRLQAAAHRLGQQARFTGAPAGGVQRFGQDGVAPQLGGVVDPVVGVGLQHLLGRVLRAVQPLALQFGDAPVGRAGSDEGRGGGHASHQAHQHEPDLREKHATPRLLFPEPLFRIGPPP